MRTSDEAYKQFLKTFESLSYRQSYAETFSNFLDFSLYMLLQVKTDEDHQTMERLERTYTDKKEAQLMAELFLCFIEAADNNGEGFHDVLGDLFMDLVSHGRNGQFFTPQPVCDMMAQMQYSNDLAPGKTVCDPACGSGRMLMAMARLERNLKFYGADNDSSCAKMAVLNMVLNTMEGEIAWMNTLSMEHYKSWHVKKILGGTHYIPYLYSTGKGITGFIQPAGPAAAPVTDQPPALPKQNVTHGAQLSIF